MKSYKELKYFTSYDISIYLHHAKAKNLETGDRRPVMRGFGLGKIHVATLLGVFIELP